MPATSVEVLRDFAGSERLREEWDRTTARLGAPIYMTYDWVKTWWEFYGAGKELRLFLFRRDGEMTAVLPIYTEGFGFGPMRMKVARLVGANVPPKTFNPPVAADSALEAFSSVLEHLFGRDGCDLLSLGPVSERWRSGEAFDHAARLAPRLVGPAVFRRRDVQTWFDLPGTYEEYLSALGASERKKRLKRIRHLEVGHRLESDVVSNPVEVEAEFARFVEQHARQWQGVGKAGHFGAWPRGEAYNRALVRSQGRHNRVKFFRMLVDGRVVANRYTFQLGTTLYSELPAREVGEPWDKLGIGVISLMKFNEAAIQGGIKAVDSGLGGYEHKSQLGGEQYPVGSWRVWRQGGNPLGRASFRGTARLMLFLCNKLWYRRILPRMPGNFKRTQSLKWLRYDH